MKIFDIPILTYHKISKEKEFGLTTISPKKFELQMQTLLDMGYQTITFKQFELNSDFPPKPIIITFDDTYQSVYMNAYPLMQKYNFMGVLFVISDYIGDINQWEAYSIQRKYRHAAVEEIKEMLDSGFEIGSHSKSHPYLPYLNNKQLKDELADSKNFLENTFKQEIISLCYPFGGFAESILREVQHAGYRYATANNKLNSKNPNNRLCLPRRSIYSTDTLKIFQKKITTFNKKNFNYLTERLIQIGSFAGIFKKRIVNI